jgi:hypothetical protein
LKRNNVDILRNGVTGPENEGKRSPYRARIRVSHSGACPGPSPPPASVIPGMSATPVPAHYENSQYIWNPNELIASNIRKPSMSIDPINIFTSLPCDEGLSSGTR